MVDIGQDGASVAEENTDQVKIGSSVNNSLIKISNTVGGGGIILLELKKKHVVDEYVMRTMMDKVENLSDTIRQIIPTQWTVKLSKCMVILIMLWWCVSMMVCVRNMR